MKHRTPRRRRTLLATGLSLAWIAGVTALFMVGSAAHAG